MINFTNKAKLLYPAQILTLLLLSLPLLGACRQQESTLVSCLPESIRLTDFVETQSAGNNLKQVTISDKLRELRASCENNLLVDGQGKEIRIQPRPQSCGGAGFNEEIVSRRRAEIEALKQKYTVIVLGCDFNGIPLP